LAAKRTTEQVDLTGRSCPVVTRFSYTAKEIWLLTLISFHKELKKLCSNWILPIKNRALFFL